MKPEAQRIAIAEACGWRKLRESDRIHAGHNRGYYYAIQPDGGAAYDIPDYLNDLNAMHEAEKALFEKVVDSECRYGDALIEAVRRGNSASFIMAMDCVSATAAQRAEAFLRTLNLWRDNP